MNVFVFFKGELVICLCWPWKTEQSIMSSHQTGERTDTALGNIPLGTTPACFSTLEMAGTDPPGSDLALGLFSCQSLCLEQELMQSSPCPNPGWSCELRWSWIRTWIAEFPTWTQLCQSHHNQKVALPKPPRP